VLQTDDRGASDRFLKIAETYESLAQSHVGEYFFTLLEGLDRKDLNDPLKVPSQTHREKVTLLQFYLFLKHRLPQSAILISRF
jgi:hypothetical protein